MKKKIVIGLIVTIICACVVIPVIATGTCSPGCGPWWYECGYYVDDKCFEHSYIDSDGFDSVCQYFKDWWRHEAYCCECNYPKAGNQGHYHGEYFHRHDCGGVNNRSYCSLPASN